ncbi:MAG: transcription termination factor NusA [Parabacteroides sp.]|nr:transcription termination factor NusA [bacterium]
MAKKAETISMIDTLAEFKELKNIDKETMINVLEDSFRNVIAKMFGTDENYDVIINPEKGDFEIWRNRKVVADDELEDKNLQLTLTEARTIDADCEVGEEVTDEVHFADFGRRAILNLRQTLASKILELQKDSLYAKYKDKINHIVAAEVYQVWKKEVLLLDDEGNELLLPKSEQIPSDYYRKGDTVRAIVLRVDNLNNNPKIILSRTDKMFLQRLFELEVPEINDGLITIKGIARIPGERAKVSVESYDDRIDPVGACVGMKGSRIHGIVRELRNENIDVINYTSNTSLYIQRALSPAKISSIHVNEEERKAEVYLRPEEVSLAIGKGGLNIKLACMLTEYTIDVFRDIDGADEEDIYLDEFSDEIDGWVIDALKDIGCYTAKSVLAMDRNALVERADLEEQTVDDVLRILSAEFEDEDSEQAEESVPEAETEVDAEGVAEGQEADPTAADDEKMND